MKVRDIKQYREQILVKRNDIDYDSFCLGVKEEPLLKELYSGRNIHNIVGQISKFAINTETQIFYEFLQNADDAKASKLAIFFDDDWFLVVNNGNAFKTDGTSASGQLRSFLNKEDSDKYFDDNSIGKNGLGSKLLYDLLINQDVQGSKNENLTETIINNLKSPILFSWSNINQWNELKYWQEGDDCTYVDCTQENAPLLLKILYTYYPAYFQEKKKLIDGSEKELFSVSDIKNLQSMFFGNNNEQNTFFNKQSEFSFEKGTAILIPLGNGVAKKLYEAIADDSRKLIEQLATSLSFLQSTKKVFINDFVVKPIHNEEQIIDFEYRSKKRNLQNNRNEDWNYKVKILLPSNLEFINDKLCNIYQYLPVSGERKNLGFIINADELELIQNRQNIDWKDYSTNTIKIIGENLVEKLEDIAINNKDLYFHFLKCFAKAKGNFLEEYLENPIKTFLLKNLPSNKNSNQNLENIKIKSTQLNINPADIGLDFYWLDESFKGCYEDFKGKFGLEEWTIFDLLDQTNVNVDLIKKWILALSNTNYAVFLTELGNKMPKFPFIKTSNGNILTREELKNNENIIPLTSKTAALKAIFDSQGIEYTNTDLTEKALLPYFTDDELIRRITNLLVKENINENQKHTIFKTFKTHFVGKEKELAIFKNRKGIFYRLGELVKNDITIAPSGILHDFQIDPTEPYFNEYEGCFLKEEFCWNKIRDEWNERIKSNISPKNYKAVIEDLRRLYSENVRAYGNTIFHNNKTYAIGFDANIDWILTTNNILITPGSAFLHSNLANLNQEEYDLLCNFVAQNTNLSKVERNIFDTIKDVKFSNWSDISVKVLHDNLRLNKYPINANFVSNLQKIYSDLLSYFIFTEENGQLYLEKKNDRIQFYSNDNELVTLLEQHNYLCLPRVLQHLNLNGLKIESDEFANELINNSSIGANQALINLVTKCNIQTKQNYLDKLQKLNLTTNQQYNYVSYEYKVIELMSNNQLLPYVPSYKQKIYIDEQQLSAIQYTDTVTVPDCHGSFSLKDLENYNGININAIKGNFINLNTTIFDTAEKPLNQIIVNQVINGEQVAFLHTQNRSQAKANYPNVTEIQILDSFYRHNLSDLQIVFTDLPQWIFLENEDLYLLLENEKIPDWLRNWCNDDNKKKWLKDNKLRFGNCSSVKLRRNYNQNISWAKNLIDEEVKNVAFANSTFEWLSQKEDFHSDFVKNYIDFEQAFVLKNSDLPNYLLVKQTIVDKQWLIVKKDILLRSNCVYFKQLEDNTFLTFREKLKEKGILYLLGIELRPDTKFEDKIKEHFYQLEKEESIDEEKLLGCLEWTADFYKKWKIEYSSHRIKISNADIPALLKLKYGNPLIEIEDRSNAECKVLEKEHKKEIYVKADADKPKSILDVIEKHLDNAFHSEQDKFVKLQSLFIEELIETENQGNGDGNINIPEATDEDKAFLEEFAKRILENKEAIMAGHFGTGTGNGKGKGRDEDGDEQEDEIADRAKISGRIGELAIYFWLKNHRNFDVHDHANQMQPYDLLLKRDSKDFHLEIKTKAGSFNEDGGSIPIFLRQSQKQWIRENKIQHYFLTTISLKDVGLYDFYKRFRDKDLEIHENEIRIALENEMSDYNYKAITENEFHMRLTSPNSQDDPFS